MLSCLELLRQMAKEEKILLRERSELSSLVSKTWIHLVSNFVAREKRDGGSLNLTATSSSCPPPPPPSVTRTLNCMTSSTSLFTSMLRKVDSLSTSLIVPLSSFISLLANCHTLIVSSSSPKSIPILSDTRHGLSEDITSSCRYTPYRLGLAESRERREEVEEEVGEEERGGGGGGERRVTKHKASLGLPPTSSTSHQTFSAPSLLNT
mmetsp:Transcript_29131/g.93684  ORF Transcript_29131/g.93684 Transcript_29131/m.93684 type:complete len:208 (-) Transcript_29131:175-798(-)